MASFHILTPDAQYSDDATIERAAAGSQVKWSIYRERHAAKISQDIWKSCDALVVWHEMPVDAQTIARLDRCKIIVRAGVGFDHIDLDACQSRSKMGQ